MAPIARPSRPRVIRRAPRVKTNTRRGRRATRSSSSKSDMVHVRVPSGVKEKAVAAFEEMGVPMSTVLRYLLNFVAKQKALPFRIEMPNADTVAAMVEIGRA